MIKKLFVTGVCGLVLFAALSIPALADQSIGYQHYYNEGLTALKEHNDQKALRCFKLAEIYDPDNTDLRHHIELLEEQGVVLAPESSQVLPEQSLGYRHYLKEGIKAFDAHERRRAIYYFNLAIIFNPNSQQADYYLQLLSQPNPFASVETPTVVVQQTPQPQVPAGLTQPQATAPAAISQSYMPSQQGEAAATPVAPSLPQSYTPSPEAQSATTASQPVAPASVPSRPAVYVPALKPKQPPTIIELSQILNSAQGGKPTLQIELNSAVILEGKDIQRFLLVDEGFIGVKTLSTDRLEIDAIRIGTTFLHVWDDGGRHTFYVEVIFPKSVTSNVAVVSNEVQHAQPFRFTYSNDWSTYYTGQNASQLKRQTYDFNQTLGMTGETPYGFVDASGSYSDYDGTSEFDTYTLGLSQIPLEGTSNFNVRGFDALRYLSPLTMPSIRLRGAFADVDLLNDNLGLSVSHGQQQIQYYSVGLIASNQSQYNSAFIDSLKLTLFPKSDTDRYAFNFATGYGKDRLDYQSGHVYSVEGHHKFDDFLTLNGEEGTDSQNTASLASLRWDDGKLKTGLNFRDIDKNYATVYNLPSNQGETGVAWTTEADWRNITADSFVETYRDHLDPNPDDTTALNYDANGHVRANITDKWWTDSDFNYVDTPGELSPRRSLGLNQRLSRNIGIWNTLKATVFAGAGYQNSHSSDADIADFDREDVIGGVQVPLTDQVSTFGNYEYDWLNQPSNGGRTNPGIINAGVEYTKQFNPKFSINSQVEYRNELGVKDQNNSFLSGEESVIISSGFAYNPTADISFFGDGDVSRVISHAGNLPYDDFEVHVGMRITFGGANYWDPLGTVTGIVFKDRNQNGKFGPGDEGIPGVKVKVGDKFAVTGQDGRFRIQVRAKGVDVVPVLDTIPGGLIFSTPQNLNVPVFQGRTTHADFGLISQTGIYGIVFIDKSATGIPNDSDQFVGKVRIILDGNIIQRSDAHGAFYFRKVAPGTHTIAIDLNSLSINMVPVIKLKNTIEVAEGTNYMFNVPVKVSKVQGSQD